MSRKFITTIVAVALAVTAFGRAPARADDNLIGALAAIAGIAIVGKVIHDHNKKKQQSSTVTRNIHRAPIQHNDHRVYNLKPRPLPQRASRKLLPGNCLRSVDTWQGRLRYFGQRCLKQQYKHVDRLPQACALRVRSVGRGYDALCLRNKGYQLARR
ncbi:hypothetical protein [Roseobacter sp.]|uniref:hypothetical protein n=1 Tax=Roseobacter sp. TaxID=1907202 RepID=UPI00385F81FA